MGNEFIKPVPAVLSVAEVATRQGEEGGHSNEAESSRGNEEGKKEEE